MPSLFDEHETRQSIKRIAASKSPDDITIADARVLHAHLDKIIKEDEQKHSVEAVRLAKLQANIENDTPELRLAVGQLRRLGLTLATLGNIQNLNDAMAAARWKHPRKCCAKRRSARSARSKISSAYGCVGFEKSLYTSDRPTKRRLILKKRGRRD
jgi:hypothetical protein